MEKVDARGKGLNKILDVARRLVELPISKIWSDYDKEADVLYISFKRPQSATNTIDKNGVLFRYKGKELVGITILEASKR
ncbi:DUF2283 domain-containing protein [Candidatus Peregrinibacteria bacterium]|nr:DUF2283 domain-containing protein [Candidatus Peregrinibacteria bacterium]